MDEPEEGQDDADAPDDSGVTPDADDAPAPERPGEEDTEPDDAGGDTVHENAPDSAAEGSADDVDGDAVESEGAPDGLAAPGSDGGDADPDESADAAARTTGDAGDGVDPADRYEPATADDGTSEDDTGPDYQSWTEGFEHTTPEPANAEARSEDDADAAPDGESGAPEAETDGAGGSMSTIISQEAGESTTASEPDPDPPSAPTAGVDEPEAPPDDEEMPLSAHIEEMIRRLAVVVAAAGLATAIAFPAATRLLNTMWYGVLPPDVPPPTLYGPLEKLLSEIKVASLAGILIALPVLVYEAYLFMRPGLYPNERRYFLAAVPTSLVLGSIGMAFAYFLILPFLFQYFITYSESAVDALPFGLRITFDLIVSLLGAFALVFQIPLLIMLAVMIGVVTRRWLERQRLLFWGLFLGVGFFISLGDATGTAPIIIALTMIGLFEGTLALLRWTGRN